MFARKIIVMGLVSLALSACVTNAGTQNPYASGAIYGATGQPGVTNIHAISGGELHW